MAEILPNASYVRNPAQAQQARRNVLESIGERSQLQIEETSRIWQLLETPQTVESLCRSLGDETGSSEITSLLAELYDRDLIELSPDS